MERPIITFLTDFGLDGAAATCRGVILSICREAQIVDIGHNVRKYAIADGAWILRASLPYMPIGVHVAVVDPGVGTERRPIAIKVARGDVLVGPDNGLLLPPAEALGGAVEARILANRHYWLPATTATFHGRDIFAPVAAHLAAGTATFEQLGPLLALEELVRLAVPSASVRDGALETAVTYVDSFGNVRLAGGRDDLAAAIGSLEAEPRLEVSLTGGDGGAGQREPTHFRPTFGLAPVGSSLLYVDSSGGLALADNQGNAAARLGLAIGDRVRITLA
ncbi:MAG: SAM-dependent chlorinase/fluorinase [Chloroflexota bacterium]|nr:SAM-dependent chlorinase/fluorinase [Chloroflexota bacterium]